MSKFPVEISDKEGIVDAVNYLLSGPQGLGQSFSGFSASDPGFVTGNFRVPYGATSGVKLYVPPIALSTAEMLDGATYKFTFAAAEPTPPFKLGNNIEVAGVADSWYNDSYTQIGVIECTTTYVVARGSGTFYEIVPPSTGGTVTRETAGSFISTECNAKVTVTSATDRVFISGQINNLISVAATTTSTLMYQVLINRYRGYPNTDPTNPGFLFDLDGVNATIAYRDYTFQIDPVAPVNYPLLPETDTIFASVIDSPGPGYYWYILEILFQPAGGDVQPEYSETYYRGFTAQVVKQ
jgi:hypothetical protein